MRNPLLRSLVALAFFFNLAAPAVAATEEIATVDLAPAPMSAAAPIQGLAVPTSLVAQGSEMMALLSQSPALIENPQVRAAAVAAFGASAVAKIQARAAQSSSAAIPTATAAPEIVVAKLEALRASFEALGRPVTIEALPSADAVVASRSDSSRYTLEPSRTGLAAAEAPRPAVAKPAIVSAAPKRATPAFWRAARNVTLALGMAVSSLVMSPAAVAQNPPRAPIVQVAEGRAVHASSVADAVARWSPENHLYVVGNVPNLDNSGAQKIEKDLAGSHWTVFLIGDAAGLRYNTPDGRTVYDDDAADWMVNMGINKQAGFVAQTNPRTGEQDGTIYKIVVAQKATFFYGSTAQRTRLGDKPITDLHIDEGARRELHNGFNVAGAVSAMRSAVDDRVNGMIDREFSDAAGAIAGAKAKVSELERVTNELSRSHPGRNRASTQDIAALTAGLQQAQARLDAKKPVEAASAANSVSARAGAFLDNASGFQRDYASATSSIQSAEVQVSELETAAGAMRRAHPTASGDLARPNIAAMKDGLKTALAKLESNPSAAGAEATAIRQQAKALTDGLAGYSNGQGALDAAAADLTSLSSRGNADAARQQLLDAKQGLESARDLYKNADSGYATKLQGARDNLASAEKIISDADASQRAANLAFMLLMGLLSLATFGAGFMLHLRTRKPRDEARELRGKWRLALDEKLDQALSKLDADATTWLGPVTGPNVHEFEGATKELAASVRKDIGSLSVIWNFTDEIFKKADKLVNPGFFGKVFNFFWPSRYKEAVALLKDKDVIPKDQDMLRSIFGKERTWNDKLYGDLASYNDLPTTFEALINEFNVRAKRASEGIALFENSTLNSGPAIERIQGLIKQAADRKAAIEQAAAADKLFLVPSLFGALIPAAQSSLAQAQKMLHNDVVGAVQSAGAEAERAANDARALADAVLEGRAAAIPKTEVSEKALQDANIGVGWIDSGLRALSDKADALAAAAAKTPAGDKIVALKAEIGSFAAKTDSAVSLAKAVTEAVKAKIEAVADAVAAARQEIGKALGLDASKILTEKNSDPSEMLKAAEGKAADSRKSLGVGAVDKAQSQFGDLNNLSAQAQGVLDATRKAFAAQEQTVVERRAETNRLDGLVPDAQRRLVEMRKNYAKSALLLTAGDAAHPNADGTVDDNIDEAQAEIASAKDKVEKAVAAFKTGKILGAADLLRQVAGHQAMAQHRISEIIEKEARLAQTVTANAALVSELARTVVDFKNNVVSDRRVMKPTIAAYDKAVQAVKSAKLTSEAEKGDPFQGAAELASAKAALLKVRDDFARCDIDVYEQSQRTIAAAASQVASAEQYRSQAKNDGAPESPAETKAYADIRSLEAALDQVKRDGGADHGDWHAVDHEADRIAHGAATVAATIKGEIEHAQAAMDAISSAARDVRNAGAWTGSYGVEIPGSPGSGELSSARRALENGDYSTAERYARAASNTAASAIAEAEAEVARRAEAERQRIEAERRRREEEERERQRQREAEEERERERERERESSGSDRGGFGGGMSSGSDKGSW